MTSDQSPTASGGASVRADVDDDGDEYTERVGGYGGHGLLVAGHGRIVAPKREVFVAPEAVISAADIASLYSAMLDGRRCCRSLPDEPEYIDVALENDPQFHARSSPRDEVRLLVSAEGVCAVVDIVTRREPAWSAAELSRLLTPAVAAYDCAVTVGYTVDGVDPDHAWDDMPFRPGEREALRERLRSEPHEIHVAVSAKGSATVEPLLAAGRDAAALLVAYERGDIDVAGARHLVRAGKPHLLIGLVESDWLEVKRGPYRINAQGQVSTRSKIELAQDVARFANGDVDAILIVGIDEHKRSSQSYLAAVSAVPLADIDPDQYSAVIDQRVVPPLDGLLVEQVDMGNGLGVLMISVPRQPEEMQPFLVHGAIMGDKVEGAFFSIVRRRGEASITTSAAQIHAYIAAGKAFLRGKQ
ncbi:MAG: hypothetical protein ACRDRL_22175 [Sciscionella sp.]